jgi:hypothetical protein
VATQTRALANAQYTNNRTQEKKGTYLGAIGTQLLACLEIGHIWDNSHGRVFGFPPWCFPGFLLAPTLKTLTPTKQHEGVVAGYQVSTITSLLTPWAGFPRQTSYPTF